MKTWKSIKLIGRAYFIYIYGTRKLINIESEQNIKINNEQKGSKEYAKCQENKWKDKNKFLFIC